MLDNLCMLCAPLLCFLSVHGHVTSISSDAPIPTRGYSLTAHEPIPSNSTVWERLGSPRYILAPMVDASELPWRLLSRRYGAELCYTPMVGAHQFVTDRYLRQETLQSTPEDRPLIIQFCGNDASNMTAAAKMAEPYCDGIDINIGCPQKVAQRGHYGAYLQDEWDLLTELIRSLRAAVSVLISCKIRIYPDVNKTVEYAKMLERAGCQLLAVHGRTLDQRGMNTGLASWEHIAAVRKGVRIPVIANGNIQCLEDVHRCLEETGVAGVMTAEGNLYNPALFSGQTKPAWELAAEYLDLAAQYPVRMRYVRGHMHNLFHHLLTLPDNYEMMQMRQLIGKSKNVEDLRKVVPQIRDRFIGYHEGQIVWCPPQDYDLKLPPWLCQSFVRPTAEERELKQKNKTLDQELLGFPKARKIMMRKAKYRWNMCTRNWNKTKCKHPRSNNCEHQLCRKCCIVYCKSEARDCIPHKQKQSTNSTWIKTRTKDYEIKERGQS
uniref:tRNA-dihydrouridine(16/17) synthase [NAD(P)(+)] n=1 Tax=Cacopsylla melanoneura TaxID=428564 RepID=A0A8D8X8I6_9HEMI